MTAASVFLSLLLMACGNYEGDDPGECTDGADNDRDGDFDCNDDGCEDSPHCEGGGADDLDSGNSDGDAGDDDGPGDSGGTSSNTCSVCCNCRESTVNWFRFSY